MPWRFGLYYAALYAGTGVSQPYISLWLHEQGLSGAAIGVLLAIPMLARVVTGPVLAVWADGFVLRRTPMIWLAGGSAAASAALLATKGLIPWAAAWFVASTLLSMLSPLADVMALRHARLGGFHYGLPRGIGSSAYVAANILMGQILAHAPVVSVVIWTIAAAALASIAARVLLPDDPVSEGPSAAGGADRWRGVSGLLTNTNYMLAILSTGLVVAAHGFYYGFSTLIWRKQGLTNDLIGWLWGTGVIAEVVFFWFMEPFRRRLGPARVAALGAAGAVVRWTALAFTPPVWLLFPLQTLHALSFSATFVASLPLIEQLSPREAASAAQSLNSALSAGIIIGLATLASGPLYDHVGALGYLSMSAMAAVGLAGVLVLTRRLGPPQIA